MRDIFWESIYSNDNNSLKSLWGNNSDFFDVVLLEIASGSKALDLGCGDGRNSIYIAKKGHIVTGVDISENAISKLQKHALQEGLIIKSLSCDLMQFEYVEKYDLVLLYGVLNSIDEIHESFVVENMKKNTASGGYNVLVIFTKPPGNETPDGNYIKYFSNPAQVKERYKDWELVKEDFRIFSHSHNDQKNHTHKVNRLIFKKII